MSGLATSYIAGTQGYCRDIGMELACMDALELCCACAMLTESARANEHVTESIRTTAKRQRLVAESSLLYYSRLA